MRSFFRWLLERRLWLAIVAVLAVQLVPPVAGALLIADGARYGWVRNMPIAAAVLAMALLIGIGGAPGAGLAATAATVATVAGFGLGSLLNRVRNLDLAFQSSMLGLIGLVLLVGLLGPSPERVVGPLIVELSEVMRTMGGTPAQVSLIENWDPVLLVGTLSAVTTVMVLSALMLGYWCLGVVEQEVEFGKHFRALRLGRTLGFGSMAILTASLFLPLEFLRMLAPVVVIGFLFQGLSVMHAWLHPLPWGHAGIAAAYLSLVTPLNALTITALCAAGLVDNFFSLRRPLERRP